MNLRRKLSWLVAAPALMFGLAGCYGYYGQDELYEEDEGVYREGLTPQGADERGTYGQPAMDQPGMDQPGMEQQGMDDEGLITE